VTAFADRHPGVQHFEPLFAYSHLPAHLAEISAQFRDLAESMLEHLPADGPELTTGLRKLVESKDCFVRHMVLTRTAEDTGRTDG
jgi:hypothetical protein